MPPSLENRLLHFQTFGNAVTEVGEEEEGDHLGEKGGGGSGSVTFAKLSKTLPCLPSFKLSPSSKFSSSLKMREGKGGRVVLEKKKGKERGEKKTQLLIRAILF